MTWGDVLGGVVGGLVVLATVAGCAGLAFAAAKRKLSRKR
jgi:hypothetical protein